MANYKVVDVDQLETGLTDICDTIRQYTDDGELAFPNGIKDAITAMAENQREAGQGDMWDMVQNFGDRTRHEYAFSRWSGKNFNPKHPISSTNCDYMFNQFATDIEEALDLRDIDLDTSNSTSFQYMCNGAKISAFGTIDTTSANSVQNIFYNAKDLHSVFKMVIRDDGSQTAGANVFLNCGELVNIEIQGKWGNSISARYSTKLSNHSIYSFVNALLDTATGQTLTLSKTAVNRAFETSEGAKDGSTSDEWNILVDSKPNWTIALV